MGEPSEHVALRNRVLLLLPTQRDADLTAEILEKNGIAAHICANPGDLEQQLCQGTGAVLLNEESLASGAHTALMQALQRQPRWSDLPILVLTRSGANSDQAADAIAQLGNVTLLERPLRLAALISTVRTALRARERQYQIRTHLEDLERARKEGAESARRKDEFLAMLGHELRNPLAPIRNALHLLDAEPERISFDENILAMMKRQVDHMVRLVDDLVEVSRLSRGTIDLRRELVDLKVVLRNSIDISRPLIEARNHKLVIDLSEEPLMIEADPVRIAQVFGNLLNNAAKYSMPNGHIILAARRQDSEVVVSVRDRGIGIEPEMLPHVFEMFIQGRRKAHRAQDGLGIGLTMVRSLVEMHGGSVSAASEGCTLGSEFVVRLAVAVDGSPPRGAELDAPSCSGIPAVGLRVLVVDDNRDAANSLGMVLKMLGIKYRVEFSGQGALDAVEQFRPDAVLLDIGMPEMDGYEVATRIRSEPRNAGITLVAVTGWSQAADQQRTRAAGFNQHFGKPADIGALQTLLATVIPNSS